MAGKSKPATLKEGTAKDRREDISLARMYGMTQKEWKVRAGTRSTMHRHVRAANRRDASNGHPQS